MKSIINVLVSNEYSGITFETYSIVDAKRKASLFANKFVDTESYMTIFTNDPKYNTTIWTKDTSKKSDKWKITGTLLKKKTEDQNT